MLNLVNYNEFPGDNRYRVFHFKTKHEADTFEGFLKEKGIWYERSINEEESNGRFLFGVHKDDFRIAQKANFLTYAKYRKPFLPRNIFAFLLLLITIGAIAVAIVGYYLSGRGV